MNSSRISRFRADPAIARAAPFALFIAFVILAYNLSSSAAGQRATAEYLWLVVARAPIVALALAWFWPGYGELRSPPRARPADWLLAVLAGMAVFLLWIHFDQIWAVVARRPGFDPRLPDGSTNWLLGLARLAGFALVVPVMEELFWRSFLLRWLEKHDFLSAAPQQTGIRAFLITAALFGLEHDQWFAGVAAGMVYNGLYIRAGNLWVPIVAHVVTNTALGVWILYTQNWYFW